MNNQQKEQLKEKYFVFRNAYEEFIDLAYSISQEIGLACEEFTLDTIMDIGDNLVELEVFEEEYYKEYYERFRRES